MVKTLISILFSVIFVAFISTPTLVSLFETDVDISAFYNLAEEENSKETLKLLSLHPNVTKDLTCVLGLLESDNSFNFYLNTYSQLSLENVSPPPERVAQLFCFIKKKRHIK